MAGIILFLQATLAYAREISAFEGIVVADEPRPKRGDSKVIPITTRRSA